MTDMKTCTKCGETKPLDGFAIARRERSGRAAQCKECKKSYYWKKREDALNYRKRYYAENRDKQTREAAARHARNMADPEFAERRRQKTAKNQAANPHWGWAKSYRWRARQLGLTAIVEQFTKADVSERYGGACFYCGGMFEQIDHFIPVAAGGPHSLENVRPCCARCNTSKRSTPGDQWLAKAHTVSVDGTTHTLAVTARPHCKES